MGPPTPIGPRHGTSNWFPASILPTHSGLTRIAAFIVMLLFCYSVARAGMDQAKPGNLPAGHPAIKSETESTPSEGGLSAQQILAQDRTKFQQNIKLDELRLLSVQHRDQVKILDSWARQSLSTMMHHQSYKGQDPLYTVLDMAFRPEAWQHENIIFIQAVPIREQLSSLANGDTQEALRQEQFRIMHTGMVSPAFLEQRDVGELLKQVAAKDVRLSDSIGMVLDGLDTFEMLRGSLLLAPPSLMVGANGTWMHPYQLAGNIPALTNHGEAIPSVPGYSDRQAAYLLGGYDELALGWRQNDATMANDGIAMLVGNAPAINSEVYRSPLTRNVELWYNRFFNGTLLAGSLYFIAMTLFLIGAVGATKSLRRWAMGFFSLALLLHISAMGVRWWLAWRIPIQNEFESVMGSAMLGCIVGMILEMRKRNNLFGLALSFVGWMAMTALFVVPFVWGKEIGESVAKVAGVLNVYWLYIHVTIVIASYALIAASFVLATVYLSMKLWHWISPISEPDMQTFAAHAVGVSHGGTNHVKSGGGFDAIVCGNRPRTHAIRLPGIAGCRQRCDPADGLLGTGNGHRLWGHLGRS